jgi:hypothetical protein
MVRKPGDVEKSLMKKGFQRKEGDHQLFQLLHQGWQENKRVHQDQPRMQRT